MHLFTKVILSVLLVISVIEVFSDDKHQKVKKDHSEEEHDAFREFDDPAEKYTADSQDEHLEIRAPSDDGHAPGSTFIPPMNMPQIRFAYW